MFPQKKNNQKIDYPKITRVNYTQLIQTFFLLTQYPAWKINGNK